MTYRRPVFALAKPGPPAMVTVGEGGLFHLGRGLNQNCTCVGVDVYFLPR